jgi:hypothetical protein
MAASATAIEPATTFDLIFIKIPPLQDYLFE